MVGDDYEKELLDQYKNDCKKIQSYQFGGAGMNRECNNNRTR